MSYKATEEEVEREAREALTEAAREFKDREEAWWATGRMPGPFQSAMIEAASLFRETYFAWVAAEQAEEGGGDE